MPKKYKYSQTFTFEGHRYRVRADDLVTLGEKIAAKKKELEEGGKLLSPDTRLKDWAYECVETYKTNQKDVTRRSYIYRMDHCILEHIGDMRLRQIRPVHCQQVLNLQAGKSKTQINEVYQTLQFLFEHAVENNLIRRNPAANLVKPSGTKHHRRALTKTERKYFLQVGFTDRRYYFFLLMLLCGCRPSEAAEAMGKDIEIVEGYPMLHIRGTKTDNADRKVPIPAELYDVIKDTPPFEYIAQSSAGGQINVNSRRRIWNSYCRNINIAMGCRMYRNALVPPYPLADDLVPYCLRHEYCTNLARQGIDIRTAQKLMGHSSVTLTANIYTNLDTSDVVSAAEILSSGVTPGVTSERGKVGKNETHS